MTERARSVTRFAIPGDTMLKEAAAVTPNRSDRLRARAERPLEQRIDLCLSLRDGNPNPVRLGSIGELNAGAFPQRPRIQQCWRDQSAPPGRSAAA